jgi:adaptin ear-binding coat-associated protein 1/2
MHSFMMYPCENEVVYRIPPLKANEGHRAQEWGDLSQPLWKGRMRIVEKSDTVSLLFEDAQTGMDPYFASGVADRLTDELL